MDEHRLAWWATVWARRKICSCGEHHPCVRLRQRRAQAARDAVEHVTEEAGQRFGMGRRPR